MKKRKRQKEQEKSGMRRMFNPTFPWAGMLALGLLVLIAGSRPASAQVQIWDNDIPGWTTTLSDGDPIQAGSVEDEVPPEVAVGANGIVYAAFAQRDGSKYHIYLSRYEGTDVRIWDNDIRGWTTNFADGDPIDTNTANDAGDPRLVVAPDGSVYITYSQSDGSGSHVYLSRYDGTDVRIWDNGLPGWTTIFANGDPIDNNTANTAYSPQLAVAPDSSVYVTYSQSDGTATHVYLSRYDGTDVRIWDATPPGWTTTFANGDPIDTGTANTANSPQLAAAPDGSVYIAYRQSDGSNSYIYLSRYDGTDVRIWDANIPGWTTTFAAGDPIDTGTGNYVVKPQIAAAPDDSVYVTYRQSDGSNDHVYLSRYDGTDVRIWDNDALGWTTTYINGDPIDNNTANDAHDPELTVASDGSVYITYWQNSGLIPHVYLSRCDGTDVRIWDNDAPGWTTIFTNGDPIDAGIGNSAYEPRLAKAPGGSVYVTYWQISGTVSHVYLSRYDGIDVRIWDADIKGWTTVFANGDPVDTNTTNEAFFPQIDVAPNGNVYVAYQQSDPTGYHVYLSRYLNSQGSPTGGGGGGGGCFIAAATEWLDWWK